MQSYHISGTRQLSWWEVCEISSGFLAFVHVALSTVNWFYYISCCGKSDSFKIDVRFLIKIFHHCDLYFVEVVSPLILIQVNVCQFTLYTVHCFEIILLGVDNTHAYITHKYFKIFKFFSSFLTLLFSQLYYFRCY
jgi:hypothetical protein